nr:uncharacterized protein LOC109189108 isoform X2 [Ipomoea batatas]
MILFAGESISALSSNDTSKGVEQRHWSYSQESAGSMNHTVPDGAIVAIEDVCQHMFIAVDRAESGYALVGEIHYTLAGERALFRWAEPPPTAAAANPSSKSTYLRLLLTEKEMRQIEAPVFLPSEALRLKLWISEVFWPELQKLCGYND